MRSEHYSNAAMPAYTRPPGAVCGHSSPVEAGRCSEPLLGGRDNPHYIATAEAVAQHAAVRDVERHVLETNRLLLVRRIATYQVEIDMIDERLARLDCNRQPSRVESDTC